MKPSFVALLLLGLLAVASATVHFREEFDNGIDHWVMSDWKDAEGSTGKFEHSAGQYYLDAEEDKGLRTTEDYRFYTASASFPSFSNKGKDLVIQYSVKSEQGLDCGGAYIKIFPAGVDQKHLNGDSQYNIMFGPDVCGHANRRVHVIFEHEGKNHLIKKTIAPETDTFTHLYTLVVSPDNTYKVLIDGNEKASGSLADDWDMLLPKEILDPHASKPVDWVDEKDIVDPTDKKPADWDDAEAQIVDPEATKPEDWDDELDGDWEPPMIANPAYKGPWVARKIPNPDYKGPWVHPKVPNPEFKDDPTLYEYDSFGVIAVEDWQVKSGSVFDNFLITDDLAEAEKYYEIVNNRRAAEREAKEADDEVKRAAAEAEREAQKEAEHDDDDDHDEL